MYKDKYITEFLLTDNCDESYTDLIKFEEPILKSRVEKIILLCMHEKCDEYTNEDIYEYLDKLGVNFTITWLGNCEKIYY